MFLIVGAVALASLAVACPKGLRQDLAERADLPEAAYVSAERQIDTFVAWARDPDQRKQFNRETER
ncbi:hypothetical protein [Maricaulis sp. CAU 1757]